MISFDCFSVEGRVKVHLDVSVSSIDKLAQESVFSATLGGSDCLCILLASQPMKFTVGVISTAGLKPHQPYWLELSRGVECLSYGAACTIEPVVGPESTPRSTFNHRRAPGILTLNKDGGLVMYFRPYEAIHDEIGYDFTIHGFNDAFGQHEVSFRRWKLWKSEDDRLRDDADPLHFFDFDKVGGD